MMTLSERPVRIGTAFIVMFLFCGCAAQSPTKHDRSAHSHPWWEDQINVMTFAMFAQPEDKPYIDYAKELQSQVADRGIFYGRFDRQRITADPPKPEEAPVFLQLGLKVTTFLGVSGWHPADASVTKMISIFKGYVDAGCDGIHLDNVFLPASHEKAPDAMRRMRDELHRYGREKYQKDIMFSGNTWQLDQVTALRMAALTDVVWTESWGRSERDVVRIERVGRSLQNRRAPVWYHYQPDDDSQDRVLKLVNLPKALFSSCLFEDARFLCNYKYPVPLTSIIPGQKEKQITWTMFYINEGWKQSVLQYAAFARTYKDYLNGGIPQSKVLVAFQPEEVSAAISQMNVLLGQGIDFNVLVYGSDPYVPATKDDVQDYSIILTPARHPELESLTHNSVFSTQADQVVQIISTDPQPILRIEGAKNVLSRVFVKGKRRMVFLKQMGYTDEKDSLPPTGLLTLKVHAPGIRHGFCASPESPEKTPLELKREEDYVIFTVPGVEYFSLIVLE